MKKKTANLLIVSGVSDKKQNSI